MKILDLFSGCGGLSLGFQKAGHEILLAVDNWNPAIETYQENFKHPIKPIDLTTEKDADFFSSMDYEMIIGGPPCQDFSSAGKRDESQGRADLTIHYADIISKYKPKWFLMENVERILKSEALKTTIDIFRSAGYGLTQTILNASYCGVPQNRKRFFLIGRLGGNDDELSYYLQSNLSPKPMNVAEYFNGSLDTEFYYRHPRSYQRRGIFSIQEPSPTIRGVNRPIPPNYSFHPGDATKKRSEVRPLTTQERAMIQTFPKDFVFVGNKGNIEQMVGNAVPVNLARYVACAINDFISDEKNDRIKQASQCQFNFS